MFQEFLIVDCVNPIIGVDTDTPRTLGVVGVKRSMPETARRTSKERKSRARAFATLERRGPKVETHRAEQKAGANPRRRAFHLLPWTPKKPISRKPEV